MARTTVKKKPAAKARSTKPGIKTPSPSPSPAEPPIRLVNEGVTVIEAAQDVTLIENETETALKNGLRATEEKYGRIGAAYRARVARESRQGFRCPFDGKVFDGFDGKKYDLKKAKKACQDHIKALFPNQAELARLEGQAKEKYQPTPVTISPTITMADLVDPAMREQAEIIDRTSQARRNQTMTANGSSGNPISPESLVHLPESMACERVSGLTLKELDVALEKAKTFGKTDLINAINREKLRRRE